MSKLKIKGLHCQYCGKEIKQNSIFCEGCGEKILDDEYYKEPTREEKAVTILKKVHRILEVSIMLNVLIVMFSFYANWGYFNISQTWINVIATFFVSLINITLLVYLYRGRTWAFFGLIALAVICFVLFLPRLVPLPQVIISIITVLVLYFTVFWTGHKFGGI